MVGSTKETGWGGGEQIGSNGHPPPPLAVEASPIRLCMLLYEETYDDDQVICLIRQNIQKC